MLISLVRGVSGRGMSVPEFRTIVGDFGRRSDDVHAFVHETADLNKDGALSIPEVYLALPRLVHASAWNEAHLDLLWQGRCCGRP